MPAFLRTTVSIEWPAPTIQWKLVLRHLLSLVFAFGNGWLRPFLLFLVYLDGQLHRMSTVAHPSRAWNVFGLIPPSPTIPDNRVSVFPPPGANCRRLLSQWSAPTIRHPLYCLYGHNVIHVHHEHWMHTPFYSHLFGTAHAIVVSTHTG